MEKKLFNGVGVAIVTPFDSEGNVDIKSLKNLVQHIIDNRADFITVLGTTAESVTLTLEERELVVKVVAEQNDGRLPLLLGVGGNCTAAVINDLQTLPYIKYCQGILSVVPYYNKPSQQGIYEHFKAIAQVSPLPIVLYNVPGRTGVNMSAAVTSKLAEECPNIIGIKEASGNMRQATELLKIKRSDFSILSGEDGLVMPLVAMGFDGVISVAGNLFPNYYADMISYLKQNRVAEAAELHIKLADYCDALFAEGNPAGIKSALKSANVINTDTLRLPLVNVSDGLNTSIKRIVSELS
ncbi:MAG: 4-hydroxy-tetrahydrodipicolinate synthase [Bacteroidales bacterium]|nr:4-hydroxy-tetrahydrodipicolinate synthase [Bacteroidales bacterium]